jgi:hypothetical protein
MICGAVIGLPAINAGRKARRAIREREQAIAAAEGGGWVELPGHARATVAVVIGVITSLLGVASAGLIALVWAGAGVGPGGRPFRRRSRIRTAEVERGAAWRSTFAPEVAGLDGPTRQALADHWLAEARMEHASIASFSWLSLDRLRRLATESLLNGCFNEGWAARRMRAAAQQAADPIVRDVLSQLACDEERHVDLAWQIVAWCELRDPGTVPIVDGALARIAGATGRSDAGRDSALAVQGILPPSSVATLRRETVAALFERRLRSRAEQASTRNAERCQALGEPRVG